MGCRYAAILGPLEVRLQKDLPMMDNPVRQQTGRLAAFGNAHRRPLIGG